MPMRTDCGLPRFSANKLTDLIKYMRSGEGLTLAALILFALSLFVFPLALLTRVGLTDGEGFSLGPAIEMLSHGSVPRALWRSLESAGVSAILSLVTGTAIALLVGLTDIRGKAIITFLLLIPMMIPPHVTAIAWVQAMGPSSPVLNTIGLAPPPGSPHPLYGRGGVIALLAVQNMPLVFLVVLAALRALPREMSDAARVSGAGTIVLLRRVILPLLAPTLIAAYALAFIAALGNFGIPALLGIPGRYVTLPVLIWQRLSAFGPSMLADVAVISAILASVAILLVLIQSTLLARTRNALIGPPQAPIYLALGRARSSVEAALWTLVVITFLLPITALFGTALVVTYGLPLNAETITFDNFREILFEQSVTARAYRNSTITAGVAALVIAALCILLARLLAGPKGPARRIGLGLSTLAEITYAIPGLVISVAFILAFIRPIPILDVSIYNTLAIILLAYLCAFFSIALKPISAAFLQLDPALDEAARVAGAGFWARIRRIALPLVAPAAASGAILVFLTAYNEVTVSALLWSTGTETIGTTIYNYEDGGYTTLAAAMSAVTVIATVALMVLLDLMGRRLPPGVVPWRL
jgi:iron(III) transport system permease protein